MKNYPQARENIAVERKRESGQALAVVALVLVGLTLAAGLSIDMGYLRYEKRRLQMAADSAAIAGAAQISSCNGSPGCQAMVNEAQTNSAYNGMANNPPTTTVAINNPPATATDPHYNDDNYVEAIVTQNVPTFFMKILGNAFSSVPVSARAVAYPGPSRSCIYALQGGIQVTGFNPILQAPTCTLADGGDLTITNAQVQTFGTVYAGSYSSTGGLVTPAPIKGAPAGDPLAFLLASPPSAGPASNCPFNLYCPGFFYYPNGLVMNTPAGLNLNLPAGTYVVGGSGLNITGSGTVTGTGVTFYISGGNVSINAGSGYACDGSQGVGSKVQLSAPTDPTNPYAGILFIQSQNTPSAITLNNGDTCSGPGTTDSNGLPPNSYLGGALYFPTAQLTLNGTGLDGDNACSTIPRYTVAIAYTLLFQQNSNFGVNDCTSPPTPYQFVPPIPNPIKTAVLVE